jgi:cellulose synthase (UDP-forming)
MPSLERILLGTPAPSASSDFAAGMGRTQARWGGWWDRHPRLLRGLALLALAWMLVYLVWRAGWSWHDADPWLGGPLLAVEIFGLWNLTALTWLSWRLVPATRPTATIGHSVDVYICTYDEPVSVVRPTLVGCAALTYPHTTYLLDDGRRPEMEALAHEWGAEYVTRADNAHAKAGNINNALTVTGGDLVLMLDADHVPLPDALDALVGYFDDPKVALVQSPHDFYNHDSVQHYEVGRHEQSVFFSVIMPGKDRHGAAFWCGSAAVIRRDALIGVGGVAVETIAEDFHTTIKLHRGGWTTRYHDEVLVQGLAPHDLAGYLLQRDRWARGNLAVFTTPESPLRARELSARQRFSYFASLSSYLAGPMRLLALSTLAVALWSGQLPLRATPLTLALLWAPATLLSIAAGTALCRGYQGLSDTTHFELSTAEIYTRALRCIVRPGRTSFKVTPKEGIDEGGWRAVRQLRVVILLALLLGLGVIARIVDDAGVNILPRMHGMALWVVPLVATVEFRRVMRTLAIVGRRHQVRSEYRVPLEAPVAFSVASSSGTSMVGHVCDISPSGLRMLLPEHVEPKTTARAMVRLPSVSGDPERVQLDMNVMSCRETADGWSAGARVCGVTDADQRRLLEYCYVTAATARLRGTESLAQPSRIAMLPPPQALELGEILELAEALGIERPTASHHTAQPPAFEFDGSRFAASK